MSERAEKLKPILDALSPDERAEIIDYLVGLGDADADEDMTREEWEAAWAEEINRRVEAIRNGTAKMIPGDEVMRRLREKFG
jgi:putative addiction module component (TIGR02574 family)